MDNSSPNQMGNAGQICELTVPLSSTGMETHPSENVQTDPPDAGPNPSRIDRIHSTTVPLREVSEPTHDNDNVEPPDTNNALRDEVDHGEDLHEAWYVVSTSVLDTMQLPSWFTSGKRTSSPSFANGNMTIDIDRFAHLSSDEAIFVSRTFLGSVHKKSLLPSERVRYEENRHFKTVFSFIPFTPSWFLGKLECMLDKEPVSVRPFTFTSTTIPQMRDMRARPSRPPPKLQGVLELL